MVQTLACWRGGWGGGGEGGGGEGGGARGVGGGGGDKITDKITRGGDITLKSGSGSTSVIEKTS